MAKKDKYGYQGDGLSNAIQTLFANIQFSGVDRPIHHMVITSAVPNEGKTTIATNLAKVIAASGYRTLLVECDLRHRSCSAALGVQSVHGIYSVLTQKKSLSRAVVSVEERLDFLDGEAGIPNPTSVFNSVAFMSLKDQISEEYDYIIYDTPPVGTFVDAAVLARLADATILAVRPEHVTRDEVLKAYEQLQSAGANVIGTCATFVKESKSSYYSSYYYSKGNKGGARAREFETLTPMSAPKKSRGSSRKAAMAATLPAMPTAQPAVQTGTQPAVQTSTQAGVAPRANTSMSFTSGSAGKTNYYAMDASTSAAAAAAVGTAAAKPVSNVSAAAAAAKSGSYGASNGSAYGATGAAGMSGTSSKPANSASAAAASASAARPSQQFNMPPENGGNGRAKVTVVNNPGTKR